MAATVNPMRALLNLKRALENVPDVMTCKIGIEASMTPEDYPMVRIVPTLVRDASVISQRQTEVTVYFGKPIHEFEDGLEALYASLFEMEGRLIDAAESNSSVFCQYQETILDEDRIDGYKLMALRMMVQG